MPNGPKRYMIPGYRERADRESLECEKCGSPLEPLEIGDRALTTPPARGGGMALRLLGPALVLAGLVFIFFVARSWRARTIASSGTAGSTTDPTEAEREWVARTLEENDD
mgnify:CR=1 FL=1